MRSLWLLTGLAGVLTAAAAVGACSATNGATGSGFGGAGGDGSGNGAPGSLSGPNTGGSTAALNPAGTGAGSGTGAGHCNSGPNDDADGDGWTVAQGDCNDCDPNVNPGAIEVKAVADADGGVPMPADENCDGMIDNVAEPCDTGLALDDTTPNSAVKAIGLCQVASVDGTKGKAGYAWGVMSAEYVRGKGNSYPNPALQTGLMTSFGTNVHPQEGESMLVMSSGHARTPGQAGACNSDTCKTHSNAGLAENPPNFPSKVPGCGGGPMTKINDDIGLIVRLRAPTNATGYRFKFRFYSFEFSEFVCSMFNDQFIALVNPPPMGSQNGNISFDASNNPVSVNIGFFDVCNPSSGEIYSGPHMPSPYCPSGAGDLAGTGYDGVWPASFEDGNNWGGATSWLQSQAPIGGGDEFSVQFTIWDAGDQNLDSTVVVDGFEWIANTGSVKVGTGKVPTPK